MALGHRVRCPSTYLGAALHFRDGTTSTVFRETEAVRSITQDPTVLVISFRLRFLDDVDVLHAGFRSECLIHTPLFVGFPGFRSKLWLQDQQTRIYRGVYEWNGTGRARHYAGRMVNLLAPFSNRGTARFHVIPGLDRASYLTHPHPGGSKDEAWWQLARPVDLSTDSARVERPALRGTTGPTK